jgi:beta-glucosidase
VVRVDGGVRIAAAPRELRFPEGFLFGCASAAHQVEGGNVNDWSPFERQPGRIKDGSVSGRACEHHQRFRDDLRDYAALGHNAHRFSVEWSRVEPLEGQFYIAALRHYREMVATCRQLGLEPLVTLHHFTLPLWLADRGGVCAAEAPLRFARFAAACAEAFGDGVEWWITINEPVVLATLGYLQGVWPPAQRSLLRSFAALRGLLRMHAAAALALREVAHRRGRAARVSVAHHVRGMTAADPSSLLDHVAAAVPDHLLNRWWLRCCADGRLHPPVGAGQRVSGAAGSLDWVGLNYYCDDLVAFDAMRPGALFARQFPDPRLPRSSFNWAIEPEGLRRALVGVWQQTRLPIVITENGVADINDELRPQFIVDHLAAVHRAIGDGVDVRGYMHWTGMDNFEWAEGYSQRFGLFAVDAATMERKRKPSADVYARICRAGGIPADLLEAPAQIAAEQ